METVFEYISTKDRLIAACEKLSEEKEFGIDIECENNLHHYGAFITLIQISGKENYIIDVLKLKDIGPLLKILEDKNITKIFHDISYDLRMLNSQFKCRPKNIFDTEIAAQLLGKENIGLKSLLEEYFGVQKARKFQKADWTKRPISQEMLSYAIKDSLYLIKLKAKFLSLAKRKKREEWIIEEMKYLESLDLKFDPPSFENMSKSKFISDTQRAILKRFYDIREEMAENLNRPVHFVISNKRLIEISKESPHDFNFWKNIKGVHPVIRANAKKYLEAEKKGIKEKLKIKRPERIRNSPTQAKIIEMLEKQRSFVSEKNKIAAHLIISKKQIREIAHKGHTDGLRNWQKKLLKIN